jgi:hypothetical protein
MEQEWPIRGPISVDEKDRLLDLLFLSPTLRILGLRRTHVSLGVRHIFEEQSNQLSLNYHHSWPPVQAHLGWRLTLDIMMTTSDSA